MPNVSKKKAEEYRDRLQRRADHLDDRIRDGEFCDKDCAYDKAERSALTFAIWLIEETFQ
jgi:hypothetical protein